MTPQEKKTVWLEKNGFNAEGYTYIYAEPNSYDVKEELKAAGFIFNPALLWHISKVPAGYEDKCIEVAGTQVITIMAWGEGCYNPDAKAKVKQLLDERNPKPASASDYIQPDREGKIGPLPVVLKSKRVIDSLYGLTNLFTFIDEEGNELVWFSKSEPQIEVGEPAFLRARFKAHKEYAGNKQTVVTRVILD